MVNSGAATRAALLQAALDAAERGFWVFPLGPGSKKPALRKTNWQTIATRDRDVIRRGWSQAPYNIGIACGRDLVVLDLDIGKDEPPPQWAGARGGRDVLARLTAAHRVPYPLHTRRVATPSGGEHLYFTAPQAPALRNTTGALGWCIDTRADGGYVVAPGSILRSGGAYELLNDREPAPLPTWLIPALTPPPLPAPCPVELPEVRANAYVHAALTRQFDRVVDASSGQRHDTLLSASASLGRLVGAGLLSRADAHAVLYHAAEHHIGINGFTANEADRTIDDGLNFGIARPARITLH